MWLTTSDGIQLNYQVRGQGPVLVFVAGYSGTQLEWQQEVDFFVQQHYQVVTLDQRNHGRSQRTRSNLRIARLAADLAELFLTLDLHNAVLISHSMGAAVMWCYVSLFGTQRLKALVDVDESPQALNTSQWPYGALDLTWENVRQQQDRILQTKMTYQQVPTPIWQALKAQQQAYPFDSKLNAPLLTNHLLQDWRDVIATCVLPQLFFGSVHSPIWQPGYVDLCLQLAPHGYAQIFQNSGHLPHLEEAAQFNQWVLTFLQTVVSE